MKLKKKRSGKTTGIPMGLALGLLISMVVTLFGAAVIAKLVESEKIGESSIGYSAMAVLAIASAMGAWTAEGKIQRLRLQMCLLSGVCYYLALLSMTALFFGGQYSGMGVTALTVLLGSSAVALLNLLPEKRKIKRPGKMAYR